MLDRWGDWTLADEGSSAKFELLSSFVGASQKVFSYYIQKT